MQAGVYCLSSELNDSKMNKNIYGQCQLDVLNADFSTNFSDGGLGSGFSLNGVSISGKLGYQGDDVLASIGGSIGLSVGGEFTLDVEKGIFIFDLNFILGARVEIYWKRNDK